jgi:hypothetical protein
MADDSDTSKTIESLEKQVAQMRGDITSLVEALAERGAKAAGEAGGWVNETAEQASGVTDTLRTQARSVSEAVRENPGTVSSAMVLGGIIGFALGVILSDAAAPPRRRWY